MTSDDIKSTRIHAQEKYVKDRQGNPIKVNVSVDDACLLSELKRLREVYSGQNLLDNKPEA